MPSKKYLMMIPYPLPHKPEKSIVVWREKVRVEPGGYPPGTPTDPDVQISRIRFLSVIVSLRRQNAPL